MTSTDKFELTLAFISVLVYILYFNCSLFRLIPTVSKVMILKLTVWESLEKDFRRYIFFLFFSSFIFCDALTMAAASVCSTAIYQGPAQGGVRMRRHQSNEVLSAF